MTLIYKVLFPSISTFETPPQSLCTHMPPPRHGLFALKSWWSVMALTVSTRLQHGYHSPSRSLHGVFMGLSRW